MNRRSRPRDIVTQEALWCLFAVLLIALAVAKFVPVTKAAVEGIAPPGSVIVEVIWPPTNPSDVDLWVQAPGDVPVGYSNKGGAVFNLLRDDLGSILDMTGLNYENSYSRGMPAGEYTVNLHLYRATGSLPIPCKVVVSTRDGSNPTNQILARDVKLMRQGQELTAVRFKLGADGHLVPGSVTTAFKPLRSGGKP